jgi:hypothetical protein
MMPANSDKDAPSDQWRLDNTRPLSEMHTVPVWDGKYEEFGRRREVDVAALSDPTLINFQPPMRALRRFLVALMLICHSSLLFGQSTAFTYQGRLNDGSNPANGSYDLRFAVFDKSTNGNQQGPILTNGATSVSNGLFNVVLDFGNQFSGPDRWLEIAVRTNGNGNFITLSPRQPVTAIPYAITAANVLAGGIPSGIYTNAVIFSNPGNQFAGNGRELTNLNAANVFGTFTGNGSGLTNLPSTTAANLSGNALIQATNIAAAATAGMVTNLPPSNGSNDTAMFQAIFGTPNSRILLNPSSVYYVSNIFVTNNIYADGQGSEIRYITGVKNAAFDCGITNYYQSFQNIIFNGQEIADYKTTATFPVPINYPEIWDQAGGLSTRGSSVTTRTGLRWNSGSGGSVRNCVFKGFSGPALVAYNYNGTQSMKPTNGIVSDCTFDNCFIGACATSWSGLPTYSTWSPASFAYNTAEYLQFNNCRASQCGVGFTVSAGNSKVMNAIATECRVGFAGNGTPNAQHGGWWNCTVNHCTYPGSFDSGPGYFSGIIALANDNPFIIANGEVATFYNCIGVGVLLTNTADYLTLQTKASLFGGFHTNTIAVGSSNCVAYFYGNFDPYGANDGTMANGMGIITNATATGSGVVSYAGFSGTFTGNGSGLTNLNLPFAPATNTIVYITNVTGITNASGYVTNLTLTLGTNTIYYQHQ